MAHSMADQYIDQYETLGYGNFATAQILGMLAGLDAEYDPMLAIVAARVDKATKGMEAALNKSGTLPVVTYKPVEGEADVVEAARKIMRRLIKYAESREKGDEIASQILHDSNLTTLSRKRPTKLIAAMDHALGVIKERKADLPEHETWTQNVTAARDALDKLDKDVRAARMNRREMTPEVAAARAEWLRQYSAAKLIVEGTLKGIGRVGLMSEIFDDLAEVHRVAGVVDDSATGGEPAADGASTGPK
jgi:hypothetical protein